MAKKSAKRTASTAGASPASPAGRARKTTRKISRKTGAAGKPSRKVSSKAAGNRKPKPPSPPKPPTRRRGAAEKAGKASKGSAISSAKKRSRVGRPLFKPTTEDRQRVESLAGLGLTQPEICLLVLDPNSGRPICDKTLRRHFADELERGAPKANAKVAESLYRRATKGEGPGAVTAAIWWTKCRMGWKERQVLEVESKSGVLVPPVAMTPEEWIAAAQKRSEDAKEPGAENGDG